MKICSKHPELKGKLNSDGRCQACKREYKREWLSRPGKKNKVRTRINLWRQTTPEGQAYVKKYNQSAETRKYRKRHRKMPHMQAARRLQRNNRMRIDVHFKLKDRVRNRLRKILKLANTKKTQTTFKLLGCSPDFLRQHLEAQFQPGMSWDNWTIDGWHIDHIKPCASFDLTDTAQQRECFHYTNLQPLWAKDNLRKGATVIQLEAS